MNAAARDGSEVSGLMEVFSDGGAYSSRFPVTSAMKRKYKKSEEGQKEMCEIMERIAEEERKEGRREGRREGEDRINRLNAELVRAGRYDDLKRSATDREYQARLIKELFPWEE